MSKVQICNRALSTYLGVPRINSLDEDTPGAEQCKIHYDDALETLIVAHWWDFASGRQLLAEVANDRDEWSFKYAKPADALVIRWVNEAQAAKVLMDRDENPDTDRDISGDFIYSNTVSASCEFTKLIEDPTKYPVFFRNALSAEIASNIAMPLTEDIKRARNAMEMAADMLDKAIVLDESQTPPGQSLTMPASLRVRGL